VIPFAERPHGREDGEGARAVKAPVIVAHRDGQPDLAPHLHTQDIGLQERAAG
jgi:hypothetical protein